MTDARARDEADLVRRCASGDDPGAWTEFVDRFGPLLVVLARRMLSRRLGRATDTQVDEVVSEVFLALLRRDRLLLHRYDPTWRLSTYLGVICRTEVSRLLRRERRRGVELQDAGRVADPSPAPPGGGALEAAEREAALARLREALGELPPRDRLLLTLRYLEDLDYRAIAAAADVSVQSVGPLLHRAKRRLAKLVPSLAQYVREQE